MPEHPAQPEDTSNAGTQAVIFVHAEGRRAAEADWVQALNRLGLPVYSHRALDGCFQTRADYRSLGVLLQELSEQAPGHVVFLLRAGLQADGPVLSRLARELGREDAPVVRTVLSNAAPEWNPFAACHGRPGDSEASLSALIDLLGSGLDHQGAGWPLHLAALSPAAVKALAQPSVHPDDALQCLKSAHGQLRVNDRHFLYDPEQPLTAAARLEPHESPRPAAWGALSQRLQSWLDAGSPDLHRANGDAPATLHITHSWGGGVARWISNYVGADPERWQLQLRAEAAQSGAGAGQRLSLYMGDQLDCPLASWWLQPPIHSVDAGNQAYAQILQHIIQRFGVAEIVVSSLVGHSLDALDSGLPTVQVLHDHFPLWPLLSVHPGPYLGQGGLEAALAEHGRHSEFTDRDAAGWRELSSRYLELLQANGVRLAAPSRASAELFRRLARESGDLEIEVIPHGTDTVPGSTAVKPRPRTDGRLRLVVPGRIQPGKGKQLLLEALPRLTGYAQVTLLGAGKHGEDFFGLPGVHVVPQYAPGSLREQVLAIAPDLAALLSVVPETFSYTLSEMRDLGVPVVATRVGSFVERIEDGRDGWLIEPSSEALVEFVREAHADRDRLGRLARHAGRHDLATMVSAYRALLDKPAGPPAPGSVTDAPGDAGSQAWLATHEHARRLRTEESVLQLEREVRQRTAWAMDRDQALEAEQRRNREWVAQLQEELSELRQAKLSAESELLDTRQRHEQLQQDFDQLEEVHRQVLASSSWRLTRPLRVLRRMGGNFLLRRAWNPARWPLLVSGLVRNLSTVGLRGTLMRMQDAGTRTAAEPDPVDTLEQVGDPEPPASLPTSRDPEVSVVIPAFNNWIYTAACLRSIAEARNTARFEVIVVDDASSDETGDRLGAVEGLEVLRNPENSGFIASCNRGAEMARGRYLVLLNNDTQVTDKWLDHLLVTFDQQPRAGLVGARLLYPDGTLQECGGMVFNDGSGWNYGRGKEADRPEYLHLRETDYCSGACFMIETALFRELGGFDERYRPAYYEDTDLAFRVRAAGRKVLVQPRSTVIHHEGITSGTDTDSGTKRYQLINQEKFAERWTEELGELPPRIEDPTNPDVIRQARDHRLAGRVLFIDATTPEPDQDSGSLRLTNLMRCFLDLGYGVTFMAENHAHAGRYTRALRQIGVEVIHEPWVESNASWFRDHGALYDLVVTSRHYVASHFAPLVRKYCPAAKWVFDTVDLHYLREQRLAELEDSLPLRRSAEQTRRAELAVIGQADAVLVVSDAEVEVLNQDAPKALVHVISNIHEVPGRRAGFDARRDLFFVGGYQHPPNVDAARWFVASIWPRVHEALPEARFHLVGSKAPDSVKALHGDGVVFHGFVADLDHYLDHCRLAVAPLRYGAGVKGKVNMSMAHGQPVVATPMAIEGTGAEHGRDVLVAETEGEFAEQVVRLYSDEALWTRISDAGIANVEARFSLGAARDSIERLLARLGIG